MPFNVPQGRRQGLRATRVALACSGFLGVTQAHIEMVGIVTICGSGYLGKSRARRWTIEGVRVDASDPRHCRACRYHGGAPQDKRETLQAKPPILTSAPDTTKKKPTKRAGGAQRLEAGKPPDGTPSYVRQRQQHLPALHEAPGASVRRTRSRPLLTKPLRLQRAREPGPRRAATPGHVRLRKRSRGRLQGPPASHPGGARAAEGLQPRRRRRRRPRGNRLPSRGACRESQALVGRPAAHASGTSSSGLCFLA